MKKTLTILLILLISFSAHAQTDWLWVKGGPNNSFSYGYHTIVASNGDVIIAGAFTDSTNIGTGIAHSAGKQDVLLSRYTNTGQLLWAKTGGGPYNDVVNGVIEDSKGNIFMTGDFTDTAYFSGMPLYCRDSLHQDYTFRSDIFLAKYNKDGNLIWIKRAGSIWEDHSWALAKDSMDNIFITGQYSVYPALPAPASFATFDTIQLASSGTGSAFLAKYDTSGRIIWVKKEGGGASGITVDNNGNIFTVGGCSGLSPTYFDSLVAYPINNNSYGSIFIAKFNPSGKALWAKEAGGDFPTEAFSVKSDDAGNAYFTGNLQSFNTDFGPGVSIPGSHGLYKIFIAKYSATGNLVWAKDAGVNGADNNYNNGGLILDKHANVYITGTFSNDSYFGGQHTPAYGFRDAMVCKYDSSGAPLWFAHAGGSDEDDGDDLAIDTAGNVYLTGTTGSAPAHFGPYQISNNPNQFNMFIAKLAQSSTGILSVPFNSINATVYPNPGTGEIWIRWSDADFNQAIISNTLGERIAEMPVAKGTRQLHTSLYGLADGLYFLELQGTFCKANTTFCVKH